jgi:hypothetical protein
MMKLRFKEAGDTAYQALRLGAKEGMELVLNDSQALVPLDEGPLMSNAELIETDDAIYVSYGLDAESAEYAVIQHENLAYSHAPGRQAKYLEMPFRQLQGRMLERINRRVKAALR